MTEIEPPEEDKVLNPEENQSDQNAQIDEGENPANDEKPKVENESQEINISSQNEQQANDKEQKVENESQEINNPPQKDSQANDSIDQNNEIKENSPHPQEIDQIESRSSSTKSESSSKPKKKEIFETQPNGPVYLSNNPRETPEERAESLAKRLLNNEDISIVEPPDVVNVVSYLSEYRDKHLKNHNVNEGERTENIIQKLQQERKNSIKSQIAQERAADIQKRLNEANDQLNNLQQRVNGTLESLQIENQRNLDKLSKKHQTEMDNFLSKWQSERNMKKYARASTALRQIRAQSILLMNQKRFDELRKADMLASNLEKIETEEMSRKMSLEYEGQLKNLNDKHQHELTILKMAQNRRLSEVQAAGERATEAQKKRIANLEHELEVANDFDKFWNIYHRNEAGLLSRATMGQKGEMSKRKRNATITMNLKTINTLKLPPLVDPRSKKGRSKSQVVSPIK
ncbi:hypothetical protein TRFO_15744 [Tritrichomonas foetus]|uniref:Uncharacterized protein n=1 Tax=Tritrichomonas foetus TaxID=1144522 RepID=A0A1J4KWQ7_9EUKA|nr:hypothetical protein TRFO_15744 [Tritrichomonas foetus]|eukprot:OHT13973.1 hypothetical protein TRFO_15744 [Tritrichomonas foetus]